MSKPKKPRLGGKYHKRGFLNPTNDKMAAWQIDIDRYGDYVDALLHISDCHRQISLDFGFEVTNNPGENVIVKSKFDSKLRKLNLLRKILDDLEKSLTMAHRDAKAYYSWDQQRKKEQLAKEKKEKK